MVKTCLLFTAISRKNKSLKKGKCDRDRFFPHALIRKIEYRHDKHSFCAKKRKFMSINGICFQANDNIARDEMKALEENASVAAAAAAPSSETSKKENVDRNIMFVRGETQSKSVEEAQRTQVSSPYICLTELLLPGFLFHLSISAKLKKLFKLKIVSHKIRIFLQNER